MGSVLRFALLMLAVAVLLQASHPAPAQAPTPPPAQAPAIAQQPLLPPAATSPQTLPEEPNELQALFKREPTCTEAFDDCQVCIRREGGGLGCSTPGIACSRGHWQCRSHGTTSDSPPK